MFALILFLLHFSPSLSVGKLEVNYFKTEQKLYILFTQLCFTYVLVNMIKKYIKKILSVNKPKYFCRANLRQGEIFFTSLIGDIKNEKKITLTQTYVVLSK